MKVELFVLPSPIRIKPQDPGILFGNTEAIGPKLFWQPFVELFGINLEFETSNEPGVVHLECRIN